MTGYVENPLLCEVLKEINDKFSNFKIHEYFLNGHVSLFEMKKILPWK